MDSERYTTSTINVQGDEQDAFEVYADATREQTIAFCFDTATLRLLLAAPDMLAALVALAATARTFRNVPKAEQEWGPLDDEALNAAFAAIAKAKTAP